MAPPKTIEEFLAQTELWVTKGGWKRIDEMSPLHRRRCAAQLLRHASEYSLESLIDEPTDDYVQQFVSRVTSPGRFIRDTPLFKRLVEGGAHPDNKVWLDDERNVS